MFKKVILTSIMILSVLFTHCSDQSADPVSAGKLNNNSGNSRLSKRVLNTSQTYAWGTYTYYDNLYQAYFTRSYSSHGVFFDNYNYDFQYERVNNGNGSYTNSVSIYVNNTYCSQVSWTNVDGSNNYTGWLGWDSFSYGDIQMQVNIYVLEHYIPMEDWSEPRNLQIKVYDIVSPDTPTGFSIDPIAHNNLNQAVTLGWDASSDTDVTGYQILRKLEGESQFTSIADIDSRTTTQWIDSNVPWDAVTMTIAIYKMRAVDNTHSLFSNYTSTLSSALP